MDILKENELRPILLASGFMSGRDDDIIVMHFFQTLPFIKNGDPNQAEIIQNVRIVSSVGLSVKQAKKFAKQILDLVEDEDDPGQNN